MAIWPSEGFFVLSRVISNQSRLYLYPLARFSLFWGLLGGPRRHRWIRLEILVRTHPGRGPGSSGTVGPD
eukprot:4304090-Pyramimonas_sp.AAC.1